MYGAKEDPASILRGQHPLEEVFEDLRTIMMRREKREDKHEDVLADEAMSILEGLLSLEGVFEDPRQEREDENEVADNDAMLVWPEEEAGEDEDGEEKQVQPVDRVACRTWMGAAGVKALKDSALIEYGCVSIELGVRSALSNYPTS